MDSDISLIHVCGHHNSRIPTLTLTPLAFLNVILDALAEHIMAAFLLSSATIDTITIRLSDLHGIPSISIHRDPVHFNITQSIVNKRSKRWLLQHWDNRNLTHMTDWETIDLTSFKLARETTTSEEPVGNTRTGKHHKSKTYRTKCK